MHRRRNVLDRNIIRLVENLRIRTFSILLGMYIAGAGYIAQIILIALGIERLVLNGSTTGFPVMTYTVSVLALVPVRFAAALWQASAVHRLSSSLKRSIRKKIFAHIHLLGVSYVSASGTAELTAAAIDGVESLEVYFTKFLPQLVYSLTMPAALFFVIKPVDTPTAVMLTAAMPIIPVIIAAAMKRGRGVMNSFWKSYGELSAYFLDSIQGVLALKLFGRAEERIEAIASQASSFRKVTMKLLSAQLTSVTLLDTLTYGFSALGITAGLVRYSQGLISLSGILIIILLSIEFFLPLRRLAAYFHAGVNGISAGKQINQFLSTRPEIADTGILELPEPVHPLEFSQVSFQYPEGSSILRDASLRLERGTVAALVGPSGAGKTTVARLIMRMKKPDSGAVLINGIASDQFPLGLIYDRIALVSSDTAIFNGTTADNLLLGNPGASEDEMKTACIRAGFGDECETDLYRNTGEGGRLLSGGERQRLAIARTLLRKPDFIIFDEATSSIDSGTEQSIRTLITELSADHGILIISHRFSLLDLAQRWYRVSDGNIVEIAPEHGTSERLNIYEN
jgi:ATP-binding cassette, subfamily C, bacterial